MRILAAFPLEHTRARHLCHLLAVHCDSFFYRWRLTHVSLLTMLWILMLVCGFTRLVILIHCFILLFCYLKYSSI